MDAVPQEMSKPMRFPHKTASRHNLRFFCFFGEVRSEGTETQTSAAPSSLGQVVCHMAFERPDYGSVAFWEQRCTCIIVLKQALHRFLFGAYTDTHMKQLNARECHDDVNRHICLEICSATISIIAAY